MTDKLLNKLVGMYDDIYTDKPYKRTKTVAFLICHGKIVSFGINSDKTSPMQNKYRMLTSKRDIKNFFDKEHAEICCLRKVDPEFRFDRCELVIISKMISGDFRLARPCETCMKAVKDFGIKEVYYTNKQGTFTHEVIQ